MDNVGVVLMGQFVCPLFVMNLKIDRLLVEIDSLVYKHTVTYVIRTIRRYSPDASGNSELRQYYAVAWN